MVKAPAAAFTTVSVTQPTTKMVHEYYDCTNFLSSFFADGPGDPSSTVPSPRAGKSKFAFRGFSASV